MMTYKEWLLKERKVLEPKIGDKVAIILDQCSVIEADDIARFVNIVKDSGDLDKSFDKYFKNCYVEIDGNDQRDNQR